MITRMQVARYVATQLPQKRRQALREAAAWLIETGRTRQAKYLLQDVAMVLAQDGYLAAQLTTARPLESAVQAEIETFLAKLTETRHVELTAIVDADLMGGMRLTTPTAELDTSVRSKLAALASSGGQR
jgi:F0F1-type ATP synthase delta subunit